jgi:outer membrane protein assembly factor BamB
MTTPKQYEKIRAIAATVNGDRFAVAEFDSKVQVWDLTKGLVNKFSTDFGSGGNRLSISEDGKYLVVGGYSANTITVFNIDTGEQLWQRKDLKKCGTVKILNKRENRVFVNLENQGTHILDINTGETIDKLKGVELYYENPYGTVDLLEKSTACSFVDRIKSKTIKSKPKTTFAILDTAFSIDKIFCAYSTNPLEAISTNNFERIWATRVVGHFLQIEYAKELDKILGVRWEYTNGSPKFLCYVDINTGKVENEINLGEPIEMEFLKQGSFLLTSQGKIYSTSTGQQTRQFDFESE